MIEITSDVVREGLKALVAQAGEDFVYSMKCADDGTDGRCVYVHEGEPDCIVGQFLANLGVPVERLALADKDGGMPASTLLYKLDREGVIELKERETASALNRAQMQQDMGKTWGYALKGALEQWG